MHSLNEDGQGPPNLVPSSDRVIPETLELPPNTPAETIAPVVINQDVENPPWSGLDLLIIMLVLVAALFVFSLFFAVAARHGGHAGPDLGKSVSPQVIVPAMTLSYLAMLVAMYVLVTRHRHLPFWQVVGWRWPEPREQVACVAGGAVLAIGLGLLSRLLPIPKSMPMDEFFRDAQGAYLMAFFGVTVAPLAEEMLFRGFLYPVLDRWLQTLFTGGQQSTTGARLGRSLAVIITAMAFALVHSQQLGRAWAPLLVLFVVGLVLTIIRAVTRSVTPGFLIHVGYNLTLFLLLYSLTDHFRHLERITE
jgi:membrane protease YdiL (CAAX protease family)